MANKGIFQETVNGYDIYLVGTKYWVTGQDGIVKSEHSSLNAARTWANAH